MDMRCPSSGTVILFTAVCYLIIIGRFGLWKVPTETTADTVYNAIKAGYRLFDGAFGMGPSHFQNEFTSNLDGAKITEMKKRLARVSNALSMMGLSSVPIYSSLPSYGILSMRRIV